MRKMHGMTKWPFLLVALLVLIGCVAPPARNTPSPATTPSPQPTTTPATTQTPAAAPTAEPEANILWSQLRNGTGYVVLLRHAITTPGTGDPDNFVLTDCSTQRNLSDEGRAQSARIGEAFRRRNIQITQVLSSQYCRCLDTARLMNLGEVVESPMLNSFFEDRNSGPAQTEQVRQAILAHREQAGVLIMVTHMVNITAISGVSPRMGGAVVMRANTNGELEVAGEVRDW
jgi:phosphohistidine phosphatase SixA